MTTAQRTAVPVPAMDVDAALRSARIYDLERALCRPLEPADRRALVREFLNLTDRKDAS